MRRLIGAVFFLWSSGVFAEDVKGASDHPLVGRYEGSTIIRYQQKDYEEFPVAIRAIGREDKGKKNERNSTVLAGKYWRYVYEGPENRSALEVFRNLERGLADKGFETVFTCRAGGCGNEGTGASNFWMAVASEGRIVSNWDSQGYIAARLARPEGDIWVSLVVVEKKASGKYPLLPQVLLDIVEVKPMEADKVVFVDASAMEKEIGMTGKVALYGIYFDFDKAEIKSESDATLSEIARYLQSNPGIKLIVAGHTDGKGGYEYNLDLSRRRAGAVVELLTRKFGVQGPRLTAFGAGMAAPVASNDSEAGRTRNRRVELVKQLS